MVDLDNLLAYSTIKIVKIRDRRLGFIHYGFIFGIFLYVLIWVLLMQKRYLKIEVPVGTTRASLGVPSNFSTSFNQSYCADDNSTEIYGFVHECMLFDPIDTQFPVTEAAGLFAASRVTTSNQIANNDVPNYLKWVTTSNSTDFVANIEQFTLKLDHTVNAVKLGLQRNAVNMPGVLKDSNGNEVTSLTSPDRFGVSGQSDILQLGTILSLAGLSNFSAQSDSSQKAPYESYRYTGVVVLMLIYYDNKYSFNTDNVRYTVEFKRVEKTEFKVEETLYGLTGFDTTERVIRNRHGIRLLLLQTGQLGRFDFGVFLIEVISAMGLLAVATAVVDFLALSVMPEKQAYEDYKVQKVNPDQTPPANQVLIY